MKRIYWPSTLELYVILLYSTFALGQSELTPETAIVNVPQSVRQTHLHFNVAIENRNTPHIITHLYALSNTHISNVLRTAHQDVRAAFGEYSNVIAQNKLLTTLLLLCSTYGTLYCYLSHLQQQVKKTKGWSKWKQHVPPLLLAQADEHELAQELLKDIQERYTTVHTISDFITPLINFFNDIARERQQLERLLYADAWITWLHVHSLSPLEESTIEQAREQLQRVELIKKTLLNWICKHKLQAVNI